MNVTAFPNTGYYLYYWELDGNNVGAPNPINITMVTNHTLIAVFVLHTYTLTITGTAGGTTSPSGTGIYPYGTVVNVTASPNTGYYFDHWELDSVNFGGANPINITMYNDHALYAVFKFGPSPAFYTLNITVTKGGTTSPPPGTYIYSQGTLVNVTALPNTGYGLNHWELDGTNIGATNSTQVTMNTDHQLEAVFAIIGDVNADGIVDIQDIYLIALAYGSVHIKDPNDPRYCQYWHTPPCGLCPHSPNLDINCDGIIDVADIYIAALHYGETDP
jgi:hypothetical protein